LTHIKAVAKKNREREREREREGERERERICVIRKFKCLRTPVGEGL
jgi:hypothetical protein